MEPNDYVKMVDSLNADLYENNKTENFCIDGGISFAYVTDGFVNAITIMDFLLWNDDNDERDYNDEEDDWEPLEPFIRRQFSKLIKNITEMKLGGK